jgi:hypothetical protein
MTELKSAVYARVQYICIFLKFAHPIYENDTSPFGKEGSRGIFQGDSLLNPPCPWGDENHQKTCF